MVKMLIKEIKDTLKDKDLNLPLEAELWSNNNLYKTVSLWDCSNKSDCIVFPSMGKSYGNRHGVKCVSILEQPDLMNIFIKEFDNRFTVTSVKCLSDRVVLKAETDHIKELNYEQLFSL